eukprot:311258_1
MLLSKALHNVMSKRLQYIRIVSLISRQNFNQEKSDENNNNDRKKLHSKKDRVKEAGSRMRKKPLTKAKPFSHEYDHVRKKIRDCKSSNDIWKIVHEYKNAGDYTIITAAMSSNTLLLCKDTTNDVIARKQLFEMWDMIDKSEIGDGVAHSILISCCNKLRISDKCDGIFKQMIQLKLDPTVATLGALLASLDDDVPKATEYWNLITNKYSIYPSEQCYISLFIICGNARDITTAEKMFSKCPYQMNRDVCVSFLRCCALKGDIKKIEIVVEHMKRHQMKSDTRFYEALMIGYIKAEQPQNAIDAFRIAEQSGVMSMPLISILPIAYINLIPMEETFEKKKKLLKIVCEDLPRMIIKFDNKQQEYINSGRWGLLILTAMMNTYVNFGIKTFEEIIAKYNLPLFDSNTEISTCDLRVYDLEISKFVLFEYLPTKKHLIQDTGVNIKMKSNKTKYTFEIPTTVNNVIELLQAKDIKYTKKK